MSDIGPFRREITFEPIPEEEPVKETTPEPEPAPEPVPA